jgi:hypothetical protein
MHTMHTMHTMHSAAQRRDDASSGHGNAGCIHGHDHAQEQGGRDRDCGSEAVGRLVRVRRRALDMPAERLLRLPLDRLLEVALDREYVRELADVARRCDQPRRDAPEAGPGVCRKLPLAKVAAVQRREGGGQTCQTQRGHEERDHVIMQEGQVWLRAGHVLQRASPSLSARARLSQDVASIRSSAAAPHKHAVARVQRELLTATAAATAESRDNPTGNPPPRKLSLKSDGVGRKKMAGRHKAMEGGAARRKLKAPSAREGIEDDGGGMKAVGSEQGLWECIQGFGD